ncbi:MAG TPA: T9SS type A sorting domain-containing protein [Bacteroidota bacterium]|nr:T9SS type A sorting domain-containing protein [Bacteroidota bacterium]
MTWPKGSNTTAVFTAGIWVTGIHQPTDSLRTAVQDYFSEFQPGPIVSTFNTTTNSPAAAGNPNDPRYHIYKIQKGDVNLPTSARNPDYDNWPGDLGAPYIDVNGNGKWDQGVDKPKLYGDQELWCVYNDVSESNHMQVGETAPMGIEVQATYFGFSSALTNIMYVRWKFINKSDADYDSVFVSLWSDTDLGDANDDLIACDTVRQLTYVYNGDNNDGGSNGYASRPPSDGFVLLEGPKVSGTPVDSALMEGVWRKGYRNLSAVSHVPFFNGPQQYEDPPFQAPAFARVAHAYQSGISGYTLLPFTDPTNSNRVTKFVFPGDPVTETGWTMTKNGVNPQDVRGMISVGPFTLAKGDTQEIVGEFAIAQGSDRLNSIVLLRQSVDVARKAFINNFATLPSVSATVDTNMMNPQISIICATNDHDAQSVAVTLRKRDGSVFAQANLFDDGNHGDGAAGDKIFGNTISVTPQNQSLAVDVAITLDNSETDVWQDMANITTTRLAYSNPVILSDNLNENGMVNPGENVRFNVTLANPYSFPLGGISLKASTPFTQTTVSVPLLQANSQFTPVYNPLDTNTFLDFTLPSNFSSSEIVVQLSLSDTAGNEWSDSVTFPVFPLVREDAVIQRLRGHSDVMPSVIITDKPATENKNYVIYGVDSADANATPGYSVKDSLTGSLVIQQVPLTEAEFLGHGSLPVDGFKVNWEGTYTRDLTPQMPTYASSSLANFPWFASSSPRDSSFAYTGKQFPSGLAGATGSSLNAGDFRNVLVHFSTINGYTDLNANGVYDVGEPYSFDTLNTSRSQKAYFYRQENAIAPFHLVGYFNVPLAAYDVTSDPPRQLSLVVIDKDKNNQWDVDVDASGKFNNFIYVLPDTYDPSGKTYDSTKGGIDLGNALRLHLPIPSYWMLWMMTDGIHTPYSAAGDCNLNVLLPLTSRDAFLFNPTTTTGVPSSSLPSGFALQQCYPNPFNPSTTILYSLEKAVNVKLLLYNVLGQRVKTLVDEKQLSGEHIAVWDGTDRLGQKVASGVYFYRLEAGPFVSTKKMILIK